MTRILIAWITALTLGLTGPLSAGDNPVVVELFTSQGCSSCPPADRLLAELGERDDVIPLALHVDYWDYIGWKDQFAHGAFTRRQKGYARAGGWNKIYTPQMVVNGSEDVVGSRPMQLAEMIQRHAMTADRVAMTLKRSGDRLHIRAEALPGAAPAELHLVRYRPAARVDILRGENAGRSYTYTHIVTEWRTLEKWNGRDVFETTVPVTGDLPVVVLVQAPHHGEIFAAARLR